MPATKPNRFALEEIEHAGLLTKNLRSKSWNEFAAPDAPALDLVFTICDNAAQEVCPTVPGKPMTAQWDVPDPSLVQGSDEDKQRAFRDTLLQLSMRIGIFTSLPIEKLDHLALQKELDEIGAAEETMRKQFDYPISQSLGAAHAAARFRYKYKKAHRQSPTYAPVLDELV